MDDIEIRSAASTAGVSYPLHGAELTLEPGNGAVGASFIKEGVAVRFQIKRGKGLTFIITWFKPSCFAELASQMLEASPKEAEQAFLSALLKRSRRRAKGS